MMGDSISENAGLSVTFRGMQSSSSWKRQLVDEFSDVLERNRRNIANEVSLILSKNEKELRRRLDEARCSFMIDRPCSELKQKDVLLGSFNADSASAPAAGCGHDLEQGKTLALIMKDLQHNYRFHRKGLKKLWKDWHKVQRKIACLGIEVLGSCRLDIVQASKQSGRKRNLRTTTLSRKKWEEAKAEYDSFIRNETGKVKDMSRNAIAKSRTQTKASRIEKHKCWEVVGDLARKLVAKSAQ